jgi:hypothetical protein
MGNVTEPVPGDLLKSKHANEAIAYYTSYTKIDDDNSHCYVSRTTVIVLVAKINTGEYIVLVNGELRYVMSGEVDLA